jgi:diaminopimelate decarboxylase/aspartate kinase
VVLKFGGTSVSSAGNWQQIVTVLKQRLAEGLQPLIVHSALSGVTDLLEELLVNAIDGGWEPVMDRIESRHHEMARELGIVPEQDLTEQCVRLRRIAAGIALVGEVSERLRARVMAQGELLATQLGAAYLRAAGLDARWMDARKVLQAEARKGASSRASFLSATCACDPDPDLRRRLDIPGVVWITQGFIASDERGDTVLLGRGGSDTSGSYFAARLEARRLEIWTDVPGMFSANPRAVPTARLLNCLEYDEAQEIASSGAKVLHPRCIKPLKQLGIPLYVYSTQTPDMPGTVISLQGADSAARVKAVTVKKGITLVSMETVGMWHSVGFLADAFAVFKEHGLSVDLVSTSETNVTVSLDPAANALDRTAIDALARDLERLCRVTVIGPCAAVSLVGRNIRAILHKLGDALALFEEQKIYLVTQAANDLNLTFVIDEDQGDRLVARLHEIAIRRTVQDRVLGPTWEQLFAQQTDRSPRPPTWWQRKREALLDLLGARDAAYVYDRQTLAETASNLRALPGLDRLFFAMKANAHPAVLGLFADLGLGFECVSRGEVERVWSQRPDLPRDRLIFTPNFAGRDEYAWALDNGLRTTLDNLYPLAEWPDLFNDRDLFLRIDTGYGRGHHDHVRTAGVHSKFGIPLFETAEAARLIAHARARVIGLHAHTGSGIFSVDNWREVGVLLAGLRATFPDVRALDLGGGLGVPERSGQPSIDLAALGSVLRNVRDANPGVEVWLEPGRYLVAESGVLLARVTQLKGKGDVRYVGIATGMNSLIRPALYGSYHEIVNLTRLNDPSSELVNVVGPICESGDLLGHERLLPPTAAGDVLLIATVGAYGAVMSSHYNLREPATELML